MSAENVKWQVNRAVRKSNLPAPARLIVLTLSDMADTRTGVIPQDKRKLSLTVLAEETGLGESTIKTQLANLERLGWVIRTRPDAKARGHYATTGYRLQVGAAGDERPKLTRERAKSKPSDDVGEGQEQAPSEELSDQGEGQEQAPRGPGASQKGARSKPSYIEEDDQDYQDDLFAADAAAPEAGDASEDEATPAPPKAAPKRNRKTAKPKEPDPLGDIAQELTVAFFERYKGRDIQPFVVIKGVVKKALESEVPRDVLAHAMGAVVDNGYALSTKTLSFELNRMWLEANGQGRGVDRPTTTQQRLATAAQLAADMRALDEAEAAGYQPPIMFALPPGRTA